MYGHHIDRTVILFYKKQTSRTGQGIGLTALVSGSEVVNLQIKDIRTNNVIERLNREIRRRTRVVGSFPDGNSALMLVCARLRHVAGSQWGNKKYMNMKHLEAAIEDASIAG